MNWDRKIRENSFTFHSTENKMRITNSGKCDSVEIASDNASFEEDMTQSQNALFGRF